MDAAGGRAPLAPLPVIRGRLPRLGAVLLVLSLLLHASAVWLVLPHGAGRSGVDVPPEIEVEMVDQAAQLRGTEPPSPAPQQSPPPRPQPAAMAEPAAKMPAPLPPDSTGEVGAAPAPIPPQPEPTPEVPPRPATERPPGPAAVHLGGGDADRDPLLVTGTHVVPPRPDARVHNKAPNYPADAARRHAQGTVSLRVHVTEQGAAGWVDVMGSSGDESLDRAAQEAVSLWRFQPARVGGSAVAFEYALEIRFRMDGQ